MTTYAHLHPNTLGCIELDGQSRLRWLDQPRWIGYPRALDTLSKLDRLLNFPRQTRMPNMLLIGSSNNGKSNLINYFYERNRPQENPEGENIVCPVLRIESPSTPSETSIYSEILIHLYESVPRSSLDIKRLRAIRVMRKVQLKILIIDDLHNMLAGSSVKQQQYLNMLKYLSNELQISIVGCGTGDLLRAVSIDPQIQNRFQPDFLPKWEMDKEFRQLLASFERLLPLRKPSGLHEARLAAKALAMCGGTIGELSLLLNAATEHAIITGTEQITMEVMNECRYIPPDERTRLASRI
ncbi:TniB family NTP-binding protein [Pseudomonas helleri]|uniref:TniB family NTP-binding protein n=1 Tax=Pseudomonas TaxID=286 RepID=UPI001294AE5D|nr:MULTISPECIES: TniB family NTP-binding protein [Pseudomonas]MEC4170158.1 TniB family NTP-binding protein [Pseudomonas sp. MS-1(2024)]